MYTGNFAHTFLLNVFFLASPHMSTLLYRGAQQYANHALLTSRGYLLMSPNYHVSGKMPVFDAFAFVFQ